jgi:beta-lactamase superfamily II metal-dependent hydrolase
VTIVAEPSLCILDVGHGNCAVILDDKVVIIDSGPGTTLLEFLKDEGIKEVAIVLVSHADEDHIKGLVSLIESRTVDIRVVRVNSDGLKESATWADLAYLLDVENKAGRLRFEVGLTTSDSGKFDTASVRVEILAPSPGLAVKGPGSTDHDDRKLTSNSMSVVIRLLRDGKPYVLLPGDIDETGFANLLESGQDLRAPVAVFPHHGGAVSGNSARFAASFCKATGARDLIFSIGRGRYGTPRPEIVAAARAQSPGLRIVCTQLSEHCASELPKKEPTHLTHKISRGRESRKCCAGTIVATLAKDTANLIPHVEVHRKFIATAAPSALCTR